MAEIGTLTGADILSKYIRDYGFGSETGIELPGEGAGILYNPEAVSYTHLHEISIFVVWLSAKLFLMPFESRYHHRI